MPILYRSSPEIIATVRRAGWFRDGPNNKIRNTLADNKKKWIANKNLVWFSKTWEVTSIIVKEIRVKCRINIFEFLSWSDLSWCVYRERRGIWLTETRWWWYCLITNAAGFSLLGMHIISTLAYYTYNSPTMPPKMNSSSFLNLFYTFNSILWSDSHIVSSEELQDRPRELVLDSHPVQGPFTFMTNTEDVHYFVEMTVGRSRSPIFWSVGENYTEHRHQRETW